MVSAAAGSVGHIVGQIARIKGCRTVGIAGSDDKCAVLTDELGFDAAVNYKAADFRDAFKAACGSGIDIYFDNTGGDILGAALRRMNLRGRIVCCGVVSQYDTSNPEPGPRGIPGLLINSRIRMEGFLVFDYADRYDEARRTMRQWIDDGQLIARQDEFDGPGVGAEAFVDLLAGGNVGTRIVRVADVSMSVGGWPSHRSLDGGIDAIPLPDSDGALWLCGKHVTGPDAEAALARVGATTIVCLNERHELEDRYPDYVAWLVAHRGDRAVWFPIPDLHAPAGGAGACRSSTSCSGGSTPASGLLMHCGAGIGRAGTMAACVLMTMGVDADDALDRRGPTTGRWPGPKRAPSASSSTPCRPLTDSCAECLRTVSCADR